MYNDQIASPALIGLHNPTILLSTRKIPTVELNMVLHHELIHFKRKDVWIKLFMLIVSSLH
ncbi:beta-lactamase regulatory protein 1 [Sporosarcina newyorkensis 2681]|uniref:Beta-lactamase regulatory protein 1 n=1 Tax=Sporosarcina newyorkensis 2681 TaxID=1027292 RepID=F9DWT2_9BACL|nr:beta-lactamase regulatory protein 1 [Sporosarcina newyorkensis 2681]